MTATLALINPKELIAFVVADTRLNWPGAPLSDSGSHEITFADRFSISVPSSRRKIRRCPVWLDRGVRTFLLYLSSLLNLFASARTTTEAKQLITDAYHSVVDLADELGEEAATVTALFTFISHHSRMASS